MPGSRAVHHPACPDAHTAKPPYPKPSGKLWPFSTVVSWVWVLFLCLCHMRTSYHTCVGRFSWRVHPIPTARAQTNRHRTLLATRSSLALLHRPCAGAQPSPAHLFSLSSAVKYTPVPWSGGSTGRPGKNLREFGLGVGSVWMKKLRDC